jgi:hypothetical protein
VHPDVILTRLRRLLDDLVPEVLHLLDPRHLLSPRLAAPGALVVACRPTTVTLALGSRRAAPFLAW